MTMPTFPLIYRRGIVWPKTFHRFRTLASTQQRRWSASYESMKLKVKGERKTEINEIVGHARSRLHFARECSKNPRRTSVPARIFCWPESGCIHFLRDLEQVLQIKKKFRWNKKKFNSNRFPNDIRDSSCWCCERREIRPLGSRLALTLLCS